MKKASRTHGSGAEHYSLVLAPAGWAQNIASQFVDVKDYGGQTISYNPNLKKRIDIIAHATSPKTDPSVENDGVLSEGKPASVDLLVALMQKFSGK